MPSTPQGLARTNQRLPKAVAVTASFDRRLTGWVREPADALSLLPRVVGSRARVWGWQQNQRSSSDTRYENGVAMSQPLVHIDDFRMAFGNTTVIEDLSFDVHAGETFGFLVSNGSGKTTTLRALLGIY